MAYTQQPVPIQVQVADPSAANNTDGSISNVLGGRSGEAMVAGLHGKYYTQVYRGNMFSLGTAAAGVLIPVESSLNPTFGIWNPAGNTKNVVMVSATYGFVSTTAAPGNIGLAVLKQAGATIGTLAPITGFTAATAPTVNNMLLGFGKASTVKCTNSAATITTPAGTIIGTSGFSALTTTGASTGVPMWTLREDFDGTLILPPGNFMWPTSSSTAMLTVFGIRWVWYEAPV